MELFDDKEFGTEGDLEPAGDFAPDCGLGTAAAGAIEHLDVVPCKVDRAPLVVAREKAAMLKDAGFKKKFWRRTELDKLNECEHIVGALDTEGGRWIQCIPCGKRVMTDSFLTNKFLVHAQKARFESVHSQRVKRGTKRMQQTRLCFREEAQTGVAGSSGAPGAVLAPLCGQLEEGQSGSTTQACEGISLEKLTQYIGLDDALVRSADLELTDDDLRARAASFFFSISCHRVDFLLKNVDKVETLFCLECSPTVVHHICAACLNLRHLVEKAFHNATNANEGKCRGPMVKALHASLVLEQSSFDKPVLKVMRMVVTDGPKLAFDPARYAVLKDKCRSRVKFGQWMDDGGPVVEALVGRMGGRGRSPSETILFHAVDFLSNPLYEEDRKSAVTGLFYALVEKSRGATRFDASLSPELKSKTIAAILNVNLVSAKAARVLRTVLEDVTPCVSTLKKAKRLEALKPEVSLLGSLNPTQESVSRICDAQVPAECRVFSLSMDELVLGRGIGLRRVVDLNGAETRVVLGTAEVTTEDQATQLPPERKDLVAKAKLSLIVPNDSNSHLVCVGVRTMVCSCQSIR
jgi:hypothetical protein